MTALTEELKILEALFEQDASLSFAKIKQVFGYGNDATTHALFVLKRRGFVDNDLFNVVDEDAWIITESGKSYLRGAKDSS